MPEGSGGLLAMPTADRQECDRCGDDSQYLLRLEETRNKTTRLIAIFNTNIFFGWLSLPHRRIDGRHGHTCVRVLVCVVKVVCPATDDQDPFFINYL